MSTIPAGVVDDPDVKPIPEPDGRLNRPRRPAPGPVVPDTVWVVSALPNPCLSVPMRSMRSMRLMRSMRSCMKLL